MHSTISIKFITKIAEFVVSGKVFVVFLMIELMMVHVISTEMPMPCKCVVQSLCSAMPCHAMCNVFILFRLNGIWNKRVGKILLARNVCWLPFGSNFYYYCRHTVAVG